MNAAQYEIFNCEYTFINIADELYYMEVYQLHDGEDKFENVEISIGANQDIDLSVNGKGELSFDKIPLTIDINLTVEDCDCCDAPTEHTMFRSDRSEDVEYEPIDGSYRSDRTFEAYYAPIKNIIEETKYSHESEDLLVCVAMDLQIRKTNDYDIVGKLPSFHTIPVIGRIMLMVDECKHCNGTQDILFTTDGKNSFNIFCPRYVNAANVIKRWYKSLK